jgi:hypothetical protein
MGLYACNIDAGTPEVLVVASNGMSYEEILNLAKLNEYEVSKVLKDQSFPDQNEVPIFYFNGFKCSLPIDINLSNNYEEANLNGRSYLSFSLLENAKIGFVLTKRDKSYFAKLDQLFYLILTILILILILFSRLFT